MGRMLLTSTVALLDSIRFFTRKKIEIKTLRVLSFFIFFIFSFFPSLLLQNEVDDTVHRKNKSKNNKCCERRQKQNKTAKIFHTF